LTCRGAAPGAEFAIYIALFSYFGLQLAEDLTRTLNMTMLSSHRVDEEKTKTIDEMQQYVSMQRQLLSL